MKITQNLSFAAPARAQSVTSPSDSFVARAEEGGARFYERKRFHFPWTDATRELQSNEVLEKLKDGRVQATTPESKLPVPIHTVSDLEELVTL